jgi:N4-gp56 family major capsid protein
MALLVTSTSYVALGVNFQLMKGLLSAARKKLPFFNGTLPGQLSKNGGTASVKWERLDNFAPATTALGQIDGTSSAVFFGRSTVTPTVSNVSAAMAKYGNAVLLNEEIDFHQMNYRAARFVDALGANAGESLNLLMETAYSTGFTNVRYATATAGGGANDSAVTSAITLNDIKYSVNQLDRWSAMKFTPDGFGSQNVGSSPIRASYYGICHSDVEPDIRSLTGFVSVETYGGYTQTMPFEIGHVGGVRFCSTEIIPVSTAITGASTAAGSQVLRGVGANGGYDVYSTYIYGKEAVGSVGLGNMHATTSYEMYDPANPPAVELITKGLGQVGTDLYNEISSAAWKAWFAGKVLNANWGVKIRSGASKL